MAGRIRFGFLPEAIEFSASGISVSPLGTHHASVEAVLSSALVRDHWFHPPMERVADPFTGQVRLGPRVSNWFSLPATHELKHSRASDPERLRFLVFLCGFFVGLRLLPDGFGHLHRTPIRLHELTDFYCSPTEAAAGLELVDRFWRGTSRHRRNLLLSVVNLHQVSQSYANPYEQILLLSTALDAAWKLRESEPG
jgi:hypothetical protein